MTTRIEHDLNFSALAAWVSETVPTARFATISGAHLYGFPSVDSDVDVRGCFQAPLADVVGLIRPAETVDPKTILAGREVEAVFHEVGKYLRLLLKHNGYVLEQIFSPLVVTGREYLDRLRPLAARCVTKTCYHHYRGFLGTQRKLLEKEPVKKTKTILYAYRVVLTGIHLLRNGTVEAHLPTLNEEFRLSFIPDLIARKTSAEFGTLSDLDYAFHVGELDRLEGVMAEEFERSPLPADAPTNDVHRFLVDSRLIP
jgi:predicted nucleotidyltransferase